MTGRLLLVVYACLCSSSASLSVTAAADPFAQGAHQSDADQQKRSAYGILEKYCYRCHGETLKVTGFHVLDRDILIKDRGEDLDRYIEPGSPARSMIWQQVDLRVMPPGKSPQPTAEEKEQLRRWIVDGAQFPVRVSYVERPFLSEAKILDAVEADLRSRPRNDREFYRYFTLAHLHNNPQVREDQLRIQRAALSKALNSLAVDEPEIHVPQAVAGTSDAVFAVDLRDYGFDRQLANGDVAWQEVVRVYPYGLKPSSSGNTAAAKAFEGIEDLYEAARQVFFDGVPTVRADWFVATAMRPPLYHTLLNIPETQADLDKRHGVDVANDFQRNRILRGGVFESGVSGQNRILDRHPSPNGAYWISYDFRQSSARGSVARFPLGPEFENHPFPGRAFQHAGSEIIFTLPNGLHGYMLVENKNGERSRIDAGPVEIVWDPNNTSGTPQIVTGLSCIACHKHGLIPFKDAVRAGTGVFNQAEVEKVDELFGDAAEIQRYVELDRSKYLQALEKATGDFLRNPGEYKPVAEFIEPIGEVARLYAKDLRLEDLAGELGFEKSQDLLQQLKRNRELKGLGLAPLVDGNTVKRSLWHAVDGVTSTFHEACKELDLGTAIVP